MDDVAIQKWKFSNGFRRPRICKNCIFYKKALFINKPRGYCLKMWAHIYRRENLGYSPIHLKSLTRVSEFASCNQFEMEEERHEL